MTSTGYLGALRDRSLRDRRSLRFASSFRNSTGAPPLSTIGARYLPCWQGYGHSPYTVDMPRRPRTNIHSSPSLEFGASGGAYVGFVATEADRESATEEVVIRELIQNALDAAAGNATVRFREIVMPAGEVPCIDDYAAAFEAARQHRASRPDAVISPNERQITDRIAEALQGAVRVLVCADSGSGISTDALRRLYNCGDTAKNVGRGSVGVGHLIPFTASDLRYVLYAGRTASDETTFGGHAIVATHLRPRRRRKPSNTQRDSHGYVRGGQEDLREAASAATGDTAIPAALAGWLPDTPTGSAVGIVAYNPPRRRPRGTDTERILREAAKSFVVAVHDGNLTVEATTDGGEGTLDAHTLRDTLAGCRAEKTRLRSKGVAGATAWDAYNTLIGGEHVDATLLPPGVRAWTRELPPGARTPRRVLPRRDVDQRQRQLQQARRLHRQTPVLRRRRRVAARRGWTTVVVCPHPRR